MKKIDSLVDRTKRFMRIPENAAITESMVMKHWRVETSPAEPILRSPRENRSETIRLCIESFYRELYRLDDFRLLKGFRRFRYARNR